MWLIMQAGQPFDQQLAITLLTFWCVRDLLFARCFMDCFAGILCRFVAKRAKSVVSGDWRWRKVC